MLSLSRRVSEAMVRQIFLDVTDKERENIINEVFACGNYPGTDRLNPLYYLMFWDREASYFEDFGFFPNSEDIDKVYVGVIERVLSLPNPFREVVIQGIWGFDDPFVNESYIMDAGAETVYYHRYIAAKIRGREFPTFFTFEW